LAVVTQVVAQALGRKTKLTRSSRAPSSPPPRQAQRPPSLDHRSHGPRRPRPPHAASEPAGAGAASGPHRSLPGSTPSPISRSSPTSTTWTRPWTPSVPRSTPSWRRLRLGALGPGQANGAPGRAPHRSVTSC